jgi:hypothetical protein
VCKKYQDVMHQHMALIGGVVVRERPTKRVYVRYGLTLASPHVERGADGHGAVGRPGARGQRPPHTVQLGLVSFLAVFAASSDTAR